MLTDDTSSSVAAIVTGCVVGVVVCIAIIALAIFLLWYQKRKSKDANIQGNYAKYAKYAKCEHIIASYLYVHVAIYW